MRNHRGLKNDIFDQQSRGFFESSAFRSSRPEVFIKNFPLIILKNSQENTCPGVFFNKVASLTLLKTDTGTRVFL